MFGDPLDKQFSKSLLDAARKVGEKTAADAKTAKEEKERYYVDETSRYPIASAAIAAARRQKTPSKRIDPRDPKSALSRAEREMNRKIASRKMAEDSDLSESGVKDSLSGKDVDKASRDFSEVSYALDHVKNARTNNILGKPKKIQEIFGWGNKKPKPLGPEYAHEKTRYYNMGKAAAKAGLPPRPPTTAHPDLVKHYHLGHEENS
jgi:hypothetical protein